MSFDLKDFSPRLNEVMALARKEVVRLRHTFVGAEHLLLGLISLRQGGAVDLLEKSNVDLDAVREEIENATAVPSSEPEVTGNILYTPRVKKILALACQRAFTLGHRQVGTEDLLLGIMQERDGFAARVLKEKKLTFDFVWNEVRANDPGKRLSGSG
jgi:ATP-dependent Clp protease ATP-binding subunit ClpC